VSKVFPNFLPPMKIAAKTAFEQRNRLSFAPGNDLIYIQASGINNKPIIIP